MKDRAAYPSSGGFRRAAGVACAVMLAIFSLTACEDEVVAVTGTDNPFSMYGVISPQLDSQWVRVFPIEDRLVPAKPEPLDAQVVSTNLTTGEEHIWRDSIIVDFANQYAHVYWAPFAAMYDHSYRIEVRRADGANSSVMVTVPGRAELALGTPQVQAGSVVQPVLVDQAVPKLIEIYVDYRIAYRPTDRDQIVTDVVTVQYVLEHVREGDGWLIPVDLEDDYDAVAGIVFDELEVGIDQTIGIILLSATTRLIVANEEWDPPAGVFDPEMIVEPGVLDNIENGFGFVGAGYRLQLEWLPPRNIIVASGFRAPEES